MFFRASGNPQRILIDIIYLPTKKYYNFALRLLQHSAALRFSQTSQFIAEIFILLISCFIIGLAINRALKNTQFHSWDIISVPIKFIERIMKNSSGTFCGLVHLWNCLEMRKTHTCCGCLGCHFIERTQQRSKKHKFDSFITKRKTSHDYKIWSKNKKLAATFFSFASQDFKIFFKHFFRSRAQFNNSSQFSFLFYGSLVPSPELKLLQFFSCSVA